MQSGEVTLGNITMGSVANLTRQDYGHIQQWVVPSVNRFARNGMPDSKTIANILKCVEEFSPNLVHVWGTESFWGLLTARKVIQKVALLELQGFKHAIAKVYHGGLSIREQIACIGLKEILRRSMIFQDRKRFEEWGVFEKEIIFQHNYIAVQSKWSESQVKYIKPSSTLFAIDSPVRSQFYIARPWQFSGSYQIFCSAAYSAPFKGLHVAIRAIAMLNNFFPKVKLRIAGALQKKGLRRDGYISWLNREIKRLKIEPNVEWLGALDAVKLVEAMSAAAVVLVPSYIESYCLTMMEAMIIGVPVVASYVGGLPSNAKDEESALFFSPGDEAMCAYQLERVFVDRGLAVQLSEKARKIALERNNRERIVKNQLDIYRTIISESKEKCA